MQLEILFDDRFLPMIMEGKKTTTVRSGIRNYPVGLYQAFNTEKTRYIHIKVQDTKITTFGSLTEENAKTDGFSSLAELKNALLEFYPDLTDESPVTIVYLAFDGRE